MPVRRSSSWAAVLIAAAASCSGKATGPRAGRVGTGSAVLLPEPARIALEAEAGRVEAPFEVQEDPDCSGARCVVLAENWATDGELHPAFKTQQGGEPVSAKEDLARNPLGKALVPNGTVEIPFDVARAGRYVLWARAWFHCSCGDSFYVSVDGEPPVDTDGNGEYDLNPPSVLGGSTHGRWKWFELKGRVFDLAPGRHLVRICNREDGIKIDQVLLVELPVPPMEPYVPQGLESSAP